MNETVETKETDVLEKELPNTTCKVPDDEINKKCNKIKSIFYEEIKSIIRGYIFTSVDYNGEDKCHVLYVSISNYGIKWNDRIKLVGNTLDLMAENRDYIKTMVIQIFEKYKTYCNLKLYYHEI